MKPNFLIIGAMKCGTTSLYYALNQHPAVGMPTAKEPNFFNKDDNFARGLEWYEMLFASFEGKTAIGEASVTYSLQMLYPNAAERIKKCLPEVRLIYMVRNPLEQIVSHWMEKIKWHSESSKFEMEIRTNNLYIEAAKYGKQINIFRNLFPDKNILIVFFEDFISNPQEVMGQCYGFLGLDPSLVKGFHIEPQNVSAQARRPTRLLSLAEYLGIAPQLRRLMPVKLRPAVHLLTRKSMPPRPILARDLEKWILEQIIEDNTSLLKYCAKPLGYWSFDSML